MQLSIHTEHHEHQPLETWPKTSEAPAAENNAPLQSLSKDKKNLQSNRHLQILECPSKPWKEAVMGTVFFADMKHNLIDSNILEIYIQSTMSTVHLIYIWSTRQSTS